VGLKVKNSSGPGAEMADTGGEVNHPPITGDAAKVGGGKKKSNGAFRRNRMLGPQFKQTSGVLERGKK